MHSTTELPDLAPTIYRQRLVIEGTCREPIGPAKIEQYLSSLSEVCGMRTLMPPVTHHSEKFGWAGWVHWEASGAHFYAWEDPYPFFSVDIYTCKAFTPSDAVRFTAGFFEADRIVSREF